MTTLAPDPAAGTRLVDRFERGLDAGVPDESLPAFDRALARLAETHLIQPREIAA